MLALPTTARGRATRDRIVAGAAALMYAQGVAGTSLDDVCRATATSKSQLYHYFADKSELVCAVIDHQRGQVLAAQQPLLDDLGSLAGLRAWRDLMVRMNDDPAALGGCPVGGLASEVGSTDPAARRAAAGAFADWGGLLREGFTRMRAAGVLPETADPESLAVGVLAALQGGLLLAQTTRDVRPLEIALDHALAGVEALSGR